MSVVGIVVVVVVAIFAASILGAWLRGGTSGPQGDSKAVREDVQRMLTTQAQGFAAQMGQLTQLVSQQLSEVRRDLEQGVTSASQITNDAQRDMTEQLRSSTDVLNRLNQHLGEVQQSGRELTQAAQTMQAVRGGAKARGVPGEAQPERLLAGVLPESGDSAPLHALARRPPPHGLVPLGVVAAPQERASYRGNTQPGILLCKSQEISLLFAFSPVIFLHNDGIVSPPRSGLGTARSDASPPRPRHRATPRRPRRGTRGSRPGRAR